MPTQKLSISLPSSLVRFSEHHKTVKRCKSRSEVIEEALVLLQEKELEQAYQQASAEIDEAWDVALADGLVDETW